MIHANNSGIVARFITAVAALGNQPIVLTGDLSIRTRRSLQPLLDALNGLGASAYSTKGDGYAPVVIQGPLKGGKVLVDGSDSQPISALLIAASLAKGGTEIEVINVGERPWIALTLDWLQRLGMSISHEDYTHYSIQGSQKFASFHYAVPGDFSSSAFPVAAALILSSKITCTNLDRSDLQGDQVFFHWIEKNGCKSGV